MAAAEIQIASITQTAYNTSVNTYSNIGLATGIQEGDLLLCHGWTEGDAYGSNTGGYTHIASASEANLVTFLLAKIAGPSEATFNISIPTSSRGLARHMRVKGHRTFDYLGTPTTASSNGSNVNNISVPSYTVGENDELVLLFGATTTQDGTDTPSGFTEVYDPTLASPSRGLSLYQRVYPIPGGTGAVVYDITGSNSNRLAAILIGVKPAAGDLVGMVGV